MEQQDIYIFNPIKKNKFYSFLSLCIFLIADSLIIFFLSSPEISTFGKVFTISLIIPGGYYLVFSFLNQFMTHLTISKPGIRYSQPFFSVFCEWRDIIGFRYTNATLELIFNENAVIKQTFFSKIFTSPKTILLHFFVKEFDKKEDWESEPVLLEIRKYLPKITGEYIKKIPQKNS